MFIQFIVNAHNVRKTTKMVNFDHIFDVFSIQYKRIVLIHFSSCQTSPGTSLEYPHHMHLSIFENWPFWAIFWPFWAIFEAVWAISSQSTPCWFNLHLVRHLMGHSQQILLAKIITMRLFSKLSNWAIFEHFQAKQKHHPVSHLQIQFGLPLPLAASKGKNVSFLWKCSLVLFCAP